MVNKENYELLLNNGNDSSIVQLQSLDLLHDNGECFSSNLRINFFNKDFTPRRNDVIIGKGTKLYCHAGNETFRSLVDSRYGEYTGTKCKVKKSQIISSILGQIRMNGGTFIKYDTKDQLWFEADTSLARDKTSQAFRNKTYKRNMKYRRNIKINEKFSNNKADKKKMERPNQKYRTPGTNRKKIRLNDTFISKKMKENKGQLYSNHKYQKTSRNGSSNKISKIDECSSNLPEEKQRALFSTAHSRASKISNPLQTLSIESIDGNDDGGKTSSEQTNFLEQNGALQAFRIDISDLDFCSEKDVSSNEEDSMGTISYYEWQDSYLI